MTGQVTTERADHEATRLSLQGARSEIDSLRDQMEQLRKENKEQAEKLRKEVHISIYIKIAPTYHSKITNSNHFE